MGGKEGRFGLRSFLFAVVCIAIRVCVRYAGNRRMFRGRLLCALLAIHRGGSALGQRPSPDHSDCLGRFDSGGVICIFECVLQEKSPSAKLRVVLECRLGRGWPTNDPADSGVRYVHCHGLRSRRQSLCSPSQT